MFICFFFLLKLKLYCFVMRFSYCFSSLALFYFGLSIFWPIKICVYFIFPLFLTISFSLNNRLQCTFFSVFVHCIVFDSFHTLLVWNWKIFSQNRKTFFWNAQVAKWSVFSSIEIQFVETFAGYYEKIIVMKKKCSAIWMINAWISNDKWSKKMINRLNQTDKWIYQTS